MEYRKPRLIDANDAVLSVINTLSAREKDIRREVDSIGNVYSIFFHNLVIHFSGILIQREATTSTTSEAPFPYVSSEYALSPRLVDLRPIETTSTSNSINKSIRSTLREIQILPLAVGNSIPFGYRQNFWLSKFVNLLGEYQKTTKVFIHRAVLQFDNLDDCIQEICRQHSIPNVDVIRRNWFEHVSQHSTEELVPIKPKMLLVGNRQDLQNRKLVHNFLEHGKEVVAFTHGEIASTIFNEPMYRYAERGLCSTLVEYGEAPNQIEDKDAMIAPKRTLYRDSQVAVSRYTRSSGIYSKKLDSVNALYIPTTYVGNHIYGPFHAYPDSVYFEWHLAIFRTLPSATFKAHPKSRGGFKFPGREDRRWLDDCIQEYDVLILDYVATSTALAMLTDKPVIFFDIGLRRLAEDFFNVLKERCHYVRIDINGNFDQQIKEGVASFSSSECCWSNLKVGKYCFSENESFSWKDIFRGTMKNSGYRQ